MLVCDNILLIYYKALDESQLVRNEEKSTLKLATHVNINAHGADNISFSSCFS